MSVKNQDCGGMLSRGEWRGGQRRLSAYKPSQRNNANEVALNDSCGIGGVHSHAERACLRATAISTATAVPARSGAATDQQRGAPVREPDRAGHKPNGADGQSVAIASMDAKSRRR